MDIPIGAGVKWIQVEGVVLLGGKNLRWISLVGGGGGMLSKENGVLVELKNHAQALFCYLIYFESKSQLERLKASSRSLKEHSPTLRGFSHSQYPLPL